MNKDIHWYGINLLPLYVEIIDNRLNDSLNHLQLLEKNKDSQAIDPRHKKLITFYEKQKTEGWMFFEQCGRWRGCNPSNDQLKMIAYIENMSHQLETVTLSILNLLKEF
ncbi:TPA: hypothetical protein ACK8S9_002839 [Legionella pneumophila]